MNAKDFLNNSTSDFVKGLNAAEKIIIANLMERYAAVKSMPLTHSECFSGDCIETIIQREAEMLTPCLPLKRGAAYVTGVAIGDKVEMYSSAQKKYVSVEEWNKENEGDDVLPR